MRGPDAPSGGRRRASQISMPAQASARAGIPHDGRPRRFSVANWSVSTRLAALCAMASVLGLVFGGLRISDAVDTSDAYTRTVQLAVIGTKITTLAQAMEDERDLTAGRHGPDHAAVRRHGSDKAGPEVLASLNTERSSRMRSWPARSASPTAPPRRRDGGRRHRVGVPREPSRAKPRT